jgi:sugar phosphate permease
LDKLSSFLFSLEKLEMNLISLMECLEYSILLRHLTSAVVFFWLGKLTDQFNLTLLGLITLGLLSGFAFLISSAETLIMLFLSLFGLRLFGQSMISHIAVTAMARWFSKKRGRALSIALMGHPIGEALTTLSL